MNRSIQVRTIYRELKQQVGHLATDYELLKHANALVEIFASKDEWPRLENQGGPLPSEYWELDTALADGGWKVFWHEMHSGKDYLRDEWEGVPQDLLEGRINLEELTWQM